MPDPRHLALLKSGRDSWNSWRRDNAEVIPDLAEAQISSLELDGADLRGVNLKSSVISGVNLRGADLRGADLRNAVLRHTDLREADIHGAKLAGADLENTNLAGANYTAEDLVGASVPDSLKREWAERKNFSPSLLTDSAGLNTTRSGPEKNDQKPGPAIATCPQCGKLIKGDSPSTPCAGCGAPLTEVIAAPGQTGNPPSELPFSFGACFISVLWLFFHGKPGWGVLLILYNLVARLAGLLGPGGVILILLISLGIQLGLGFNGSAIAWTHKNCRSVAELKTRERAWTIAGIIVGLVLDVPLTIASLVSISRS